MRELLDLMSFVQGKLGTMFSGAKFTSTLLWNSLFILAVEAFVSRRWKRYLTLGFVTDLSYFLFFACGFYYFLFSGPMGRGLNALTSHYAPFLQMGILEKIGLPPLLYAAFVVVFIDGVEYAMHRLGHANRFYWKFHCMHHSAQQLTPLTKFRVHWMDMLVFGTVKAIPMMILGLPATLWMPIVPLGFLQMLSHFDLDWDYGFFGKIVVSPRFHRIHHSSDPVQYNTNFGIIFSFWDYVFGTAAETFTRPEAYGIPGMKVPESFTRQFFYPFLLVAEDLGLLRASQPAVRPELT